MPARLGEKQRLLETYDRAGEKRLLEQSLKAPSVTKRILWLRQAAASMETKVAPLSACKSGCASCCHIGVALTQEEAQTIARETGAWLDIQAGHPPLDDHETAARSLREDHYGKPCTFLVSGRCSIYHSRPLACRLAFSLDDDDLLCQIHPGAEAAAVPYVGVFEHHLYAVKALGLNHAVDDIRHWFPQGLRRPEEAEHG